jgi:hypothetical protein
MKWKLGLLAAGIMVALLIMVVPAVQNQLTYGTFSTQGPPPRIEFCNRRYYPAGSIQSGNVVLSLVAHAGRNGVTRVGTTPSGMAILADYLSPSVRAVYNTNVCAMALWVRTGQDAYLPYTLSGGP